MQMEARVNELVAQVNVLERRTKRLECTNAALVKVAEQTVFAAIAVLRQHGRW
jgi:hypothetical protein